MAKKCVPNLSEELHRLQSESNFLGERLEAIALLVQCFEPTEFEVEPVQLRKIGWLIQDYADKARCVAKQLGELDHAASTRKDTDT